jgi:hypothetical protein
MTRYSIDTDGVSHERSALAHDPAELRACASTVARATADAMASVGTGGPRLCWSLDRFRTVHAYALDALADAAAALGDRLDRSTAEARSVELSVTQAMADAASAVGRR